MDLREQIAASLVSLGIGDADDLAVACSGGADSIALVHLLAHRSPLVLHVDHGLRDDSALDADFVAATAGRLGLRHAQRRVDVEPRDGSLEAGARAARYAALEQMANECGVRYVATAHTLDDQAETVLLRLLRGATLDAIVPVNRCFVRPLLGVRRQELRDWLAGSGIAWREDPTNTNERFERNWVRAAVMPVLASRRDGVAETLAAVAQRERFDREALDALAVDVFSRAQIDDVGVFLPRDDLLLVPRAIAARVIRLAFRQLGVDPSTDAVETVRTLRASRFSWRGVDVWRMPDGIAFVASAQRSPEALRVPRLGSVESREWGIRARVSEPTADAWRWRWVVPEPVGEVTIRSRRPGDRVITRAGTRKVQDVLVDAKVPRPLRALVPIVDVDGMARAVVGAPACCTPTTASGRVLDVEPLGQTWSRERAWIAR